MKTFLTICLLCLASVSPAVTPAQRWCYLADRGITNAAYAAVPDPKWPGNTTVVLWNVNGIKEPSTANCRPVVEAEGIYRAWLANRKPILNTVTNR